MRCLRLPSRDASATKSNVGMAPATALRDGRGPSPARHLPVPARARDRRDAERSRPDCSEVTRKERTVVHMYLIRAPASMATDLSRIHVFVCACTHVRTYVYVYTEGRRCLGRVPAGARTLQTKEWRERVRRGAQVVKKRNKGSRRSARVRTSSALSMAACWDAVLLGLGRGRRDAMAGRG